MKSRDCRLPNGILLNGVWKDYYDVIVTASEKERLSDEIIGFSAEDRDSLAIERSQLLSDWRASICSLTNVETSHLHAQQIIDKVRAEKDNLEMKCKSYEAQRDWLDRQRIGLRKQLSLMSSEIDLLGSKLQQQDIELLQAKSENALLTEIIQRRDVTIKSISSKSEKQNEDLDTLGKSLSTKDRRFQILLKERNRQKDELERAVAEIEKLKRFQRNQQICTNVNQDNRNITYSTPLKSNRDDEESLLQTKSNSPDEDTDTEVFSPLSATDITLNGIPSPPVGSDGSKIDGLSTVKRNLLDGDNHMLNAFPTLPPINEDNADMKDKIYRSIIKKLQKQLTIAQSQIPSATPFSAKRDFRVPDRKTVNSSRMKAFS